MKVSAATGLYERRGDSPIHRDLNEAITVLHEIGYDTFDLALSDVKRENFILGGDDWEKQIDQLGNTAAKLGVTFFQSHLPFVAGCSMAVDPAFKKPGYREHFFECTRRAYHASQMLNIPWTVLHPLTFPECNYENKAMLDANRALYDQYIELGAKLGVGTAIENLLPPLERKLAAVYCQHYDQLIELVDSCGDSAVGICWDTGHANQMQLNQRRALNAIGDRLKVLHINDNHKGFRDEHLMPYMGDVDWDDFLEGLVDIGYDGALSYESGNVSANSFGEMQLEFVRMAYRNGCYLRDRWEEKRRARQG